MGCGPVGHALLQLEKPDVAERWLREATSRLGNECADWIWNLRGFNYQRLGDLRLAEECFRQAIPLAPDRCEPLFNLGLILRAQRRYAEAIAVIEEVIEVSEDDRPARAVLASMEGVIDAVCHAETWQHDSSDGGLAAAGEEGCDDDESGWTRPPL